MSPGEFDDLERRLRDALESEAARIEPNDRRGEILAAAQRARSRRWFGAAGPRRALLPVAAAAAVAVIGAGIYGIAREPQDRMPTPGLSTGPTTPSTGPTDGTSTPTPSTGPTTGRATGPSTSATTPGGGKPSPSTLPSGPATGNAPAPPPSSEEPTTPSDAAPATVTKAIPAYFVGAEAEGQGDGLFRQFVRGQVPVDATPAELGRAALAVAMSRPAATSADYLHPWAGVQVTDVSVSGQRIDVSLSGPGSPAGLTAEQMRLAVQQLVWTVQAGVGQGSTPVRFTVDDGSTALFGRYPTSRSYDRPATGSAYTDLAPLWIDDPAPGGSVPAGTPVTASGQACTFEGTVQWQLRDGDGVRDSGTTTATSGCPTRGTWRIDLGTLAPGTYTLRVYETSAADGSVSGAARSTFTVR